MVGYLGQDSSAVVCDGDVAIRGNEDLVETARAEGGADNAGDGLCGENVRLDSVVSVLSLLLALVSYNDEGAAVFVFGDLGWGEDSCVSLDAKWTSEERKRKYRWTYQVLSDMSARVAIKLFGRAAAYAWPWRAGGAAPEGERWSKEVKTGKGCWTAEEGATEEWCWQWVDWLSLVDWLLLLLLLLALGLAFRLSSLAVSLTFRCPSGLCAESFLLRSAPSRRVQVT